MKKLFIFCLSLFVVPLVAEPLHTDIIEERDHLFILGVLSYLYNRLETEPKPCWDIAALIAWDVEDINRTPDFVIDRNRNFEKQGNIFHAELMAIEKASLKNKSLSVTSSLTIEEINKRLGMTNTTLYVSLEPFPFCTMGVTWSRIPKVVYFMTDPGLRDLETYAPVSLPKEFCGRTLTQINPSSLPLAEKINQELIDLFSQNPPESYLVTLSSGKKMINIAKYFKEHLDEQLRRGYELFCSYEVIYDQNKDLYTKLVEAIERVSTN